MHRVFTNYLPNLIQKYFPVMLTKSYQQSIHTINRPVQKYDYFLVVDFEATCFAKRQAPEPQEIIEFPVLKVHGQTFDIESTFHEYVQPNVHKELSAYCIQLTGIVQDMVEGQPYLEQVLQMFHSWMEKEKLLNPEVKFAFVTYNSWDFNKILPSQCKFLGLNVPVYMKEWIDIQKCFADEFGIWFNLGLKEMLKFLNISYIGRQHSGIDDCKNTVAIMKALSARGFIFTINSCFTRKEGKHREINTAPINS